jgi:Ca2+/Na+ antiporter
MGVAALFVAFVIRDARSRRWEGFMLVGVYGLFVLWVAGAGDR